MLKPCGWVVGVALGAECAQVAAARLSAGQPVEGVVSKSLRLRAAQNRILDVQLSFLNGEEYEYFFIVTNTERPSEEVVDFYQKRGNYENIIKEAKYDMAVGHMLLISLWSNEAIFQLMMLAYNLFLLFKIDFIRITKYWQHIRTFRLKYIFLAGKIIRTARSVVMKLPGEYPYQAIYEKSLS